MRKPKGVALTLVTIFGLLCATLVWAPPEALLTLVAPTEVTKCGEGAYTLTIVKIGNDPMQNKEVTITIPTRSALVT